MASGDINRDGGSGDQAGAIKGSPCNVRPHTSHVHALTAIRDSTSDLKLISWAASSGGAVGRKGDSDSLAGRSSRVSLARVSSTFDYYVTAVQDSGRNELLISWRLGEDGAIGRAADSDSDGLHEIEDVEIVGRDDFHNVVTGVWDDHRNLRLESWRMNQNGQFTRGGDSGNQAGEVQGRPALVALPGGIVVSAVVTKESTLKLISWAVDNDGGFRRLKDSGRQAGEIQSRPAVLTSSNGMIVTAVSDSDSKLKLIVWEVGGDGSVLRRGDSGNQGGSAVGPGMSIARTTSVWVTAVKNSSEKLKLRSWSISGDGMTVTRKGDSGQQAGAITETPAIAASNHSTTGFTTAIRTDHGALKMIAWTVEPF
jgi:hypothetical protein